MSKIDDTRRYTEQERHTAFEVLCGGQTRAFQLLEIWKGAYDNRTELDRLRSKVSKQGMKEISFLGRARQEGFTDKQIIAFLELQ